MPKISALPAAVLADITPDDLLPFVDEAGPTTKQTTLDTFRQALFKAQSSSYTGAPITGVTTIQMSGGVGVGTAPLTTTGLLVSGTTVLSTGTSQYGIQSTASFSSSSTTAGYGIYVQPTLAAAAFTQTNTYGVYVDNAVIGGGSAITNLYGIYINTPSGAATINRALHIAGGGASIAAGNLGIGTTATPAADRGLYIHGVVTVAASNTSYGAYFDPTMDSGATTAGAVQYLQLRTAAAAFTMVSGYGLYVDTPNKGAASAITTAYGIIVKSQTQGTSNNYGIFVEGSSGGAFNNTSIQVIPGTYGVRVTGTSTSSATTKAGILSDPTFDSTATLGYGIQSAGVIGATATGLYGYYSGVTTTAAAFTLTNRYGVYIDNVAKGAGSTITNDYGLYIVGPTQGGTLNLGIYVGAGGIQTANGQNGIGVGTGPTGASSIVLGNALSGTTSQYGLNILSTNTFNSAATTAGYGIYVGSTTSAVGFTQTNNYGIYIDAVAKGAGSTITNRYGLYVVNPTDGGTLNIAIYTTGAILSAGATFGIGYATGAGGTVTQATNRTTGVTLSKICGQITTNTASLAAEAAATFVVTNTAVAIGDTIILSIQSGSNGGNTAVNVVTVTNGSFSIQVCNNNAAAGTAETGAIIINFAVIKAVAA